MRSGLYSEGVYRVAATASHIGKVPGAVTVHPSQLSPGSLQSVARNMKKQPMKVPVNRIHGGYADI